MQKLLIKNGPLFVTVLSACLLVAGAAHQAQAQGAGAIDQSKITAEDSSKCRNAQQPSKKSEESAATCPSYFSHGARVITHEPQIIFYENTRALVGNNQILIVSRLPRAGLDGLLAFEPVAN